MTHLDERKRAVLRAVVEEHVRSAEPVGSEHPALLEQLRVSSATIRSTMAALEEQGLLTHPHTSAGRVPTDKGYRVYVDMLLETEPLPAADRQAIRRSLGQAGDEPEGLPEQAARVLAALTRYASVVATPGLPDQVLEALHLLPVSGRRALAVVVTDAGVLEGHPIELPEGVAPEDLEVLSGAISRRLRGVRVGDLSREGLEQIVGEASRYHQLLAAVEAWLRRDLSRGGRARLRVEGTRHLLREPEFRQPEMASRVFDALEQEAVLAQALGPGPSRQDFWIAIGAENRPAELRACSVVAATYRAGERTVGTVALVGPTRMRYRRAVAAVRYVAERLTEALSASS